MPIPSNRYPHGAHKFWSSVLSLTALALAWNIFLR
jgi:hypothetical protein